jgi:hypothetical protein
VLVYLNTTEGNSALAWMDQNGNSVSESQFAVLRAAECALDTSALPRQENHHNLVQSGVAHIMTESKFVGGQLGRPSGARFKTYERLKKHVAYLETTLFAHEAVQLTRALDEIYKYPLREAAKTALNRQLRSNITDENLAHLVVTLHQEDRLLCLVQEEKLTGEPQIICSLGLVKSIPKE